ncbi:MAG: response regulator transcription factor [Butyricicoccus pullicaecorum]|nr:response regulator transcription factor [Butyricicoccus pullicaecorum]
MAKTILVVEDEQDIATIIDFNLKRSGFDTLMAYDGPTGLKLALENAPDLILLDVMLPGMDGFEICRRVREKSQVPIIMLTAREEESDKILGLELGADDYVTKPFSNRELIARIKANMRRFSAAEVPQEKTDAGVGLSISEEDTAAYKDGKPIDLSVREFDILSYLAAEPGRVVSREELMEKVWGFEYYGDLRAVDVAIRRLREKIEDEPAQPKYIITKRGLGYYFAKN